MLSNPSTDNNNAQVAQQTPPKPFLLHPHDPTVEREYDILIKAWKHQLIDNTPTSPNTDYIRFAWIRLMDHYLDQQWLDSKQMLQCAQAWSAREDELSTTEAVHTMNILGLKSMQRSLDARQELLQVLGDPDLMAGFGISVSKRYSSTSTTNCSIITGSLQHEEEEEEDVHAPLLVQYNKAIPIEEAAATAIEEISKKQQQQEELEEYFDSTSLKESVKESSSIVEGDEQVEIKTRQVYEQVEISEEEEEEEQDTRRSISSSMSSPNLSTSVYYGFTSTTRKYESCYQKLNQASSWKEIEIDSRKSMDEEEEEDIVEKYDTSSISSSSQLGSPLLGSQHQWKSWFLGNGNEQQEELFTTAANEKIETTDTTIFADFHPEFIKKHQPFLMVRSESSISAFRPISNNLAPRCHPAQLNESLSLTAQAEEPKRKHKRATIQKSKSFPTKASLLSASIKRPFGNSTAPPPMPIPIPQQQQPKERSSNFMIRSIVSKKVSLSKLFGNRKGSTFSSASSSSNSSSSSSTILTAHNNI